MGECPPSLGLLTTAALTAADEVLIPMEMEYLALRRVGAMLRTVAKVKSQGVVAWLTRPSPRCTSIYRRCG